MTHESKPNERANTEDFEFKALQEARNYREALIQEFRPHLTGSIIEIGAGIGQMTSHLTRLPNVTNVLSVEPSEVFVEQFKLNHPNQPILCGTINNVPTSQPWNAIFSVNVLEHIEQDSEELGLYHRILAPTQGTLCLFVPARPEIYAPIDKDFGHFRRYKKAELKRKLATAGFQTDKIYYYNCLGYLAWWFQFRIRQQRHFDIRSVRLYDQKIFPIVHWLESHIARPPIGQSLIAMVEALPQ